VCKEEGAHQTAKCLNPADCNPIAIELGLDDPNGSFAILAQAMEAVCNNRQICEATDVVYLYMLDAFEKLFDNELDQGLFEEHMRWFFGNKVRALTCVDFPIDSAVSAGIPPFHTGQIIVFINQAGKYSRCMRHSVVSRVPPSRPCLAVFASLVD
jgi:hypothetical protein